MRWQHRRGVIAPSAMPMSVSESHNDPDANICYTQEIFKSDQSLEVSYLPKEDKGAERVKDKEGVYETNPFSEDSYVKMPAGPATNSAPINHHNFNIYRLEKNATATIKGLHKREAFDNLGELKKYRKLYGEALAAVQTVERTYDTAQRRFTKGADYYSAAYDYKDQAVGRMERRRDSVAVKLSEIEAKHRETVEYILEDVKLRHGLRSKSPEEMPAEAAAEAGYLLGLIEQHDLSARYYSAASKRYAGEKVDNLARSMRSYDDALATLADMNGDLAEKALDGKELSGQGRDIEESIQIAKVRAARISLENARRKVKEESVDNLSMGLEYHLLAQKSRTESLSDNSKDGTYAEIFNQLRAAAITIEHVKETDPDNPRIMPWEGNLLSAKVNLKSRYELGPQNGNDPDTDLLKEERETFNLLAAKATKTVSNNVQGAELVIILSDALSSIMDYEVKIAPYIRSEEGVGSYSRHIHSLNAPLENLISAAHPFIRFERDDIEIDGKYFTIYRHYPEKDVPLADTIYNHIAALRLKANFESNFITGYYIDASQGLRIAAQEEFPKAEIVKKYASSIQDSYPTLFDEDGMAKVFFSGEFSEEALREYTAHANSGWRSLGMWGGGAAGGAGVGALIGSLGGPGGAAVGGAIGSMVGGGTGIALDRIWSYYEYEDIVNQASLTGVTTQSRARAMDWAFGSFFELSFGTVGAVDLHVKLGSLSARLVSGAMSGARGAAASLGRIPGALRGALDDTLRGLDDALDDVARGMDDALRPPAAAHAHATAWPHAPVAPVSGEFTALREGARVLLSEASQAGRQIGASIYRGGVGFFRSAIGPLRPTITRPNITWNQGWRQAAGEIGRWANGAIGEVIYHPVTAALAGAVVLYNKETSPNGKVDTWWGATAEAFLLGRLIVPFVRTANAASFRNGMLIAGPLGCAAAEVFFQGAHYNGPFGFHFDHVNGDNTITGAYVGYLIATGIYIALTTGHLRVGVPGSSRLSFDIVDDIIGRIPGFGGLRSWKGLMANPRNVINLGERSILSPRGTARFLGLNFLLNPFPQMLAGDALRDTDNTNFFLWNLVQFGPVEAVKYSVMLSLGFGRSFFLPMAAGNGIAVLLGTFNTKVFPYYAGRSDIYDKHAIDLRSRLGFMHDGTITSDSAADMRRFHWNIMHNWYPSFMYKGVEGYWGYLEKTEDEEVVKAFALALEHDLRNFGQLDKERQQLTRILSTIAINLDRTTPKLRDLLSSSEYRQYFSKLPEFGSHEYDLEDFVDHIEVYDSVYPASITDHQPQTEIEATSGMMAP